MWKIEKMLLNYKLQVPRHFNCHRAHCATLQSTTGHYELDLGGGPLLFFHFPGPWLGWVKLVE